MNNTEADTHDRTKIRGYCQNHSGSGAMTDLIYMEPMTLGELWEAAEIDGVGWWHITDDLRS